ncbi:MAG: PDZ domain-containing protein [Phycisphaerales bacterium]|nr:PDZ domain-containing protein [Phycisphaerales bacterium]
MHGAAAHAVALTLVLGLTPRVAAQPAIDAATEAAVDALDSPVLSEREQANARLLADGSFTLADAERLLASDSLTAEQRLRMEGIGLSMFHRTPRAGLGVQFGPPVEGRGAPLNAIVPGFPAAEFLKPGDLVRSINGEPVVNTNHMGSVILSHAPGDSLRLGIDRPLGPVLNPAEPPPFQSLTLDVPLGRFEDLNNGQPTPVRVEAAYYQRLSRAGAIHTPPLVGDGLSPLLWLRAEGYDERETEAPTIAVLPVAAWRVLSFGGQPVASVSDIELRRGDEHAMMRRSSVALQADGVYDHIEESLAAYRALVRRLAQLRALVGEAPAGDADAQQSLRIDRVRAEQAELERELRSIVRTLGGEPDDKTPRSTP